MTSGARRWPFCLVLALAALPLTRAVAAYYPPPDSAGGWRTAAGEAQVRELAGMDVGKLNQAWEFTQRCTQNGGLLVVRNGHLVFEK